MTLKSHKTACVLYSCANVRCLRQSLRFSDPRLCNDDDNLTVCNYDKPARLVAAGPFLVVPCFLT